MSFYLKKYTDANSRFLVIDNAMVHYKDEGSGHPILLIHGSFSSLHTFEGWTRELMNDFRIIRLDLPGFGLSGVRPDHKYTHEAYLHFLKKFLQRLEIDYCSIAGSSLGGWLAWEFALEFPELTDKLILISSAGFHTSHNYPLPFRVARTPFIKSMFKYIISKSVVEHFIRQVYGDVSKVTPELIDRYFDLFTREGNPEAFLALANNRAPDNTRNLRCLASPTLLLWGTEDRWVPLSHAYQFQNMIPHAELILYEGIGHVPMEEAPEITSMDTRAFLLGVDLPVMME